LVVFTKARADSLARANHLLKEPSEGYRCMNRQNSKAWTEHDLKKLKDYADAGASHYRTAAALNRTVSGVRSMAQRHGIRFVSTKAARNAARNATPAPLS
jgi:hypothetical protein